MLTKLNFLLWRNLRLAQFYVTENRIFDYWVPLVWLTAIKSIRRYPVILGKHAKTY